MTSAPETRDVPTVSPAEERRAIIASSVGTVFEWYDFYLYATLAPFFASLFFPPGNETASLLAALATYAAGFLVRPFGAIVFGRIGDLLGRKYTFLITISVMGAATFLVGVLPTYRTIGWTAPVLLVVLRLIQGLALGGEYGGAATYVAEHAPNERRGGITSWIQTTATIGFFLALLVIGLTRYFMFEPAAADKAEQAFKDWGWRIPFWISLMLLGFSVYIRMRLQESPAFRKMKAENRGSKHPLTETFLRSPNNKLVLFAILGATAGQGVVWYTGQFYALFFLTGTLRVEDLTAYTLIGATLLLGTPFFVLFGRLSDRIGRRKIILAGCALAALTYMPLFKGLTHFVNPKLEQFQESTQISVASDNCHFHLFPTRTTKYTDCNKVKNLLTQAGLSFTSAPGVPGQEVVVKIGDTEISGFDPKVDEKPDTEKLAAISAALKAKGYYSAKLTLKDINVPMTLLLMLVMLIYVTMVYGPIAAYLVEMFPMRIRYTSMSFPYHIGNGIFGGMLPLVAIAVASTGNIYRGLWYPIIVAAFTTVFGLFFLKETPKDFDIHA